MQNRYRKLLSALLATVLILSLASVAAATEQEEEHEHEWAIDTKGIGGHSWKCNVCGKLYSEAHTAPDDAGNCTICGYHLHNWQCEKADGSYHTMVCNGCGEKRTVTHSFDSNNCCTVCGYQKQEHEHVWVYGGEAWNYNHLLNCTSCYAIKYEDHIYGSDGTCTVCGNAPPHEHQWEWDGNKSNFLNYHFMICSCGATTSEQHQQFYWDGRVGSERGHRIICGVCGFDAMITSHQYESTYYNGQRCTVCGYKTNKPAETEPKPTDPKPTDPKPTEPKPTEPKPTEPKPTEPKPTETEPVETEPSETESSATEPMESEPVETEPVETESEQTTPTETESEETTSSAPETLPNDPAENDVQKNGFARIWIASGIVAVFILCGIVIGIRMKANSGKYGK